MSKTIEKLYGIGKEIKVDTTDTDICILEYEGKTYQIIEETKKMEDAIDLAIGCNRCVLLELFREKETRIISIIGKR